LSSSATNIWTCFTCGLPQLSDSFFNSSHSSVNSSSTSESTDLLQDFGIKYLRNLKIGHLNINSLGGTKFLEITKILHENILDVLVIGETKLNDYFPNNQFLLSGYKIFRKDRAFSKADGGVIIYVKTLNVLTLNQLC
jgi:hypothetical protein